MSATEERSLTPPPTVDLGKINWIYLVPFVTLHILSLLVLVPWLFSWTGVVTFLVGLFLCGQVGIPICYHRQLTHRSFKTPKWLEYFFVLLALCSMQETPVAWVAWHRKHHTDSDEQEDPHSPLVSFFWAHVGWLIYSNNQIQTLAFKEKYARDLLKDSWYRSLERRQWSSGVIYLAHVIVIVAATYGITWLVQGTHMAALQLTLSVLVWGVIARTVYVWHITWSVNSISHIWGYRNYDTSDVSRNNWFVALITGGEGWHNNHHYDQAAASVQIKWWELDPNYYVIQCLELVGLATDVVRPRAHREAEREASRDATAESTEDANEHEDAVA